MNNTVKNSIRHLICKVYDQFASNKDKVSVLSLPGASWEFEKYVLHNYGFRNLLGSQLELDLVCFERDRNVYEYSIEERSDLLNNPNVSYLNEHVEQAMDVYTQQEMCLAGLISAASLLSLILIITGLVVNKFRSSPLLLIGADGKMFPLQSLKTQRKLALLRLSLITLSL